ncbi:MULTISPECIES: YnfU family zinc-binding protein [Yersinia]|uniref:YnfU family zinc-binding protein n=1 Tax=Yersinia TaxID=629 RepID=UPI00142898A1|nr:MULTISPECIES: YnfU family zinc-binding protein [Yersinia]
MSLIDSFRRLISKAQTKVTCPECGKASQQDTEKVQKNKALVCLKCGSLFLPSDQKR